MRGENKSMKYAINRKRLNCNMVTSFVCMTDKNREKTASNCSSGMVVHSDVTRLSRFCCLIFCNRPRPI